MSIVNAHILECQPDNHRSRTQLKFRLDLSKILIGDFSSRSLTVLEGRFTAGHWPVATTRGRCKRCLNVRALSFAKFHAWLVTSKYAWIVLPTTLMMICNKYGANFKCLQSNILAYIFRKWYVHVCHHLLAKI